MGEFVEFLLEFIEFVAKFDEFSPKFAPKARFNAIKKIKNFLIKSLANDIFALFFVAAKCGFYAKEIICLNF